MSCLHQVGFFIYLFIFTRYIRWADFKCVFTGHFTQLACVSVSVAGDCGRAGALFFFIHVPQLQGVLSDVEMLSTR